EVKAIAQFERMLALVPDEPIVHYQLGTLYKLAGRTAEASARFERAAALNPRLAAARFQLYNMYRQAGRQLDAASALQVFQQLKKQAEGAAIAEDVDWCNYAEVYDPPVTPAAAPVLAAFDDRALEGVVDSGTAGLAAIDSTGTGQTDLLVWSSRGIALYRRGVERVTDAGLNGVTDVISIALGDFDNDG